MKTFATILATATVSLAFLSLTTSAQAATTSLSCEDVKVANVTNYDLTKTSQTWTTMPQVTGFGCVAEDGSNPGPWRLALFDGTTIVAQSPQNGQALSPKVSALPKSGSYTLRCVQVQGNGSEKPVNTTCPGITLTAQNQNANPAPSAPVATVRTTRTAPTSAAPTLADIRQMPIVANNLDKEVGGMRVADKLQGSKAASIIQSTPAALISSFLTAAQNLGCNELENPSEATKSSVTAQMAAVTPDGGPLTGEISMNNARYVKRLEKAFKIIAKFQCN